MCSACEIHNNNTIEVFEFSVLINFSQSQSRLNEERCSKHRKKKFKKHEMKKDWAKAFSWQQNSNANMINIAFWWCLRSLRILCLSTTSCDWKKKQTRAAISSLYKHCRSIKRECTEKKKCLREWYERQPSDRDRERDRVKKTNNQIWGYFVKRARERTCTWTFANIYYCFEISLCCCDDTLLFSSLQFFFLPVVVAAARCHLLGSLVNKWYTFWILNLVRRNACPFTQWKTNTRNELQYFNSDSVRIHFLAAFYNFPLTTFFPYLSLLFKCPIA